MIGPLLKLSAALAAATLLAGCAEKFDHLGRAPSMSAMAEPKNPIDPTLPPGVLPAPFGQHLGPGQHPGVAMGASGGTQVTSGPTVSRSLWNGRYGVGSIPQQPAPAISGRASLWSRAPGSLFDDRRARYVGDILTVLIEIDDSASLSNTTERNRSGTDTVAAATVYGLQDLAGDLLPAPLDPRQGVSASGDSTSSGDGTISRDEDISLRIAARVVQVLPNGHLVVTGNQEVRVNFELRDLQVAGIIRPEDITRQNTISYDRMANARISYGGRGQITDFQQPRIGQQVIDLISPF